MILVLKNLEVWEGLEFLVTKFLGTGISPIFGRENLSGLPKASDIKKSSDVVFYFQFKIKDVVNRQYTRHIVSCIA